MKTGYIHSNGTTFRYAPVSGGGALHVLVTSSNSAAGLLRTPAAYLNQVTVDVAADTYDSPATVALGGVAFDPIAAGTTTISATAVGFTTYSDSYFVVTITP